MQNPNKILLKQTLLLVSISILLYLLGSIGSVVVTYGGPELFESYLVFYAYLFFILLVFTLISIFYFLRIRKNINLKGLNIVFKVSCWFLISTLLALFIYGIYENSYMSWPELNELNIFSRLWITIKFIDMESMMNFLYYTPYIIFTGLLYWAIRINKSFSIESGQKIVK